MLFCIYIYKYLSELKTVVTMCMYGQRTPPLACRNLLERRFCLKNVVAKRRDGSFGPNGTVWYFIVSYYIYNSILCCIYIYLYTIACYIILYYIFFTLYSITYITLYFDIVLYHVVFYFAKLYKYTILYRIMLHHFTSLHFASFFSIILHCNTVHCIALFFCFVLCCVVLETLVYRSATNM